VTMFKKFDIDEVGNVSQVKSSAQRAIRSKILEQYPMMEKTLDDIIPKKKSMVLAKCQNHLQLIVVDKVPVFFCQRDGPYFPTLRLLHQYPCMLPRLRVDKGAIRFVMSGANIMCPGVTHANVIENTKSLGSLPVGSPVGIYAEGKVYPLAIGQLKMSLDDIVSINKNIGIDSVHYLDDGLWRLKDPIE